MASNSLQDYTAFLNGTSVAHGTLKHCRDYAREVFASPRWQEWCGPKATLRIVRGARQYLVESVILQK